MRKFYFCWLKEGGAAVSSAIIINLELIAWPALIAGNFRSVRAGPQDICILEICPKLKMSFK